jgi:hypothetical protein
MNARRLFGPRTVIFCAMFIFFTRWSLVPAGGIPHREFCREDNVSGYDRTMARGWESKSVEEQQSEASLVKTKPRRPLSPEEKEKEHTREKLALARLQVLQQLEKAANPRHREMLQRALADLEAQIARLC